MDERRREKDPAHGRGGEQEPVPKVPPGDHPLGAIEQGEDEKDLVGILLEDRIVVDVLGLERQEEHRQDGGRPAGDPRAIRKISTSDPRAQRNPGRRRAVSVFPRRATARRGTIKVIGGTVGGMGASIGLALTIMARQDSSMSRSHRQSDQIRAKTPAANIAPGTIQGLSFSSLEVMGSPMPGATARGPF